MLAIGSEVFTVSRIEVKHTPPYAYKTYVAKKTIVQVELVGEDVIYTAGKYHELVFHAVGGGFETIGDYLKPVFLSEQEAEIEKEKRIEREGNEI